MQYVTSISLPVAAVALILGIFGSVSAETVGVGTNVSVSATSEVRPRPLQLLHDKLELQKKALVEIRSIRQDAKDFRADVRIDLKAASSGAGRRDVLKEARTEIKTGIKERLQVLARTHLGSAIARLNAATRNFDNLISRIGSRIEKLKARGVATASVEVSLATAVRLTATAKADAKALTDLIGSITDASDPATVKAQIRAAIDTATASVKAAHLALLKTARELSGLTPRVKAGAEATTTVDTNN